MPSQILKNHPKFLTPQDYLKALEEVVKDNAYFPNTLNKELIIKKLSEENSEGELAGYIFATKDLISNTDSIVTGGSKFLEEYKPPINASVYIALKNAGALNIAQVNLDEFGFGGTGLASAYGVVPNPIDRTRIIGGSSSGSVYLIQKGLIDFSLASDTGDSARFPAALVGIIGFKPSYGSISRYGFYPFCSSFDTPSICSNSIITIAKVFSIVSFPDPNDLCTLKTKRKNYLEELDRPIDKKLRIAIFEDTFWSRKPVETNSYKEVKNKFSLLVERLKRDLDVSIEIISFKNKDLLRLCSLIYSVVAYSEGISNYSNLTGLLFPFKEDTEGNVKPINRDVGNNYEEILVKNRSVFGDEFTRRQILGKYFLDGENYSSIYIQSKKILTLINEEVKEIFNNYDLVISPTSFDIPEKIDEWKSEYSSSNDLNIRLLANFCSLPAISIPWEEVEGMPIGLHLMSSFGSDSFLLRVSKVLIDLFKQK